MKKMIYALIFMMVLIGFSTEVHAETGVRYDTYTVSNRRLVQTQTAYVPISTTSTVGGFDIGEPLDIHISPNNRLYIASQVAPNRGRIIVFDLETEEARVIGEDFLVNPTGVFANAAGEIFVADRNARIAYQLDSDGNILQTFTRPNSPLFGAEEFAPRKIISDPRGNVFVLNLGTRGLAQFSPNGDFLGYFGTNIIQPNLRTVLQQTFFTEEQRARLFNLIPPEISNMAIDERGLIHTVSLGVDGFGVRRLNIGGGNLLPQMFNAPDLVDVFVGPIGNIYVLTRSGHIFEYDREGNLLFLFGGSDTSNQIQGLFNNPSGIAVDRDFNLYVVDRASRDLTILVPTEFANLVHDALAMFQEGDYIASQGPWQEVLKMNDFFDLAHRGLGNSYFSLGNFQQAQTEFRIAFEREGYSEAFWEVRNEWLMRNAGVGVMGFFVFLLGFIVNSKAHFMDRVTSPIKDGIRKVRKRVKVLDDILYLFTYLRNPADSSYYIKRKNRVNASSATILLALYFLFYIYYIYNLNFLFNFRNLNNINVFEEFVRIILPILLWVFCNFLIGTIREGEGRLKDVYITTIFSLAPYFLTLPILAIISNGLTFNESFILSFIQTVSILVTAIYFFFMVKETHFYGVKESLQSIAITAFTMAMLILSFFIIYILVTELFTLVSDVGLEVFYRVVRN